MNIHNSSKEEGLNHIGNSLFFPAGGHSDMLDDPFAINSISGIMLESPLERLYFHLSEIVRFQ